MPRRSIFGEVKDTNKRGQCQIYSNIAEREYLRQAKDTKSRKQCKLICFLPSAISLCQSAAGGGCAGRRRRSDAALCMGGCGLPLFGCGRRANLSKLYFSRPPACGIALQKQPNSHFGKHPAPPIGCLLQGADLPPFVTERWRQKCPQSTYVGIGRSNAEFAVRCAQR